MRKWWCPMMPMKLRSTPVPAAANIRILADTCDVVGIDEAQFFDDEIVTVCNDLANKGVRVIVAGLDMDFKGNPFGPMPALWLRPNMSPKYMRFVRARGIWPIIVLEKPIMTIWSYWRNRRI